MKKRLNLLTILCFISIFMSYAQAKYDNIWLMNERSGKRITKITWGNATPNITTITKESIVKVGAPYSHICNASGQLKYYTDGCAIAGANYQYTPYGDIIGDPDLPCFVDDRPYSNSVIILPHPSDTTLYYVFHTEISGQDDVIRLHYTEINTKKGLKHGAVTKNTVKLDQSTTFSNLGPQACKHANGKDWWVILPTYPKHGYSRILLTDNGPQRIGTQYLDSKLFLSDFPGQGIFSPDGSKFVRTEGYSGTYIYNFDRCTGLMSQLAKIDTLQKGFYAGAGISPNSRYLYLTSDYLNSSVLHQYDLQATDIKKSEIKIADDDDFKDTRGYVVGFHRCLLAPNEKIYVGDLLSDYLGIIHAPDSSGIACNFKQHDLKLPDSYLSLPNIPYFRTPALQGIICPTIVGTDDEISQAEQLFELYPNPTKGNITLNTAILIENHHLVINVYDSNGKLCYQKNISEQAENFDLPSDLPPGFYFWVITDDMQQIGHGKVVLH